MPSGTKKITAIRTAAKKKGTYSLKDLVTSGRRVEYDSAENRSHKTLLPARDHVDESVDGEHEPEGIGGDSRYILAVEGPHDAGEEASGGKGKHLESDGIYAAALGKGIGLLDTAEGEADPGFLDCVNEREIHRHKKEDQVIELGLRGKIYGEEPRNNDGVGSRDSIYPPTTAREALPLLSGQHDHLTEEGGDDGEVNALQTDKGIADEGGDERHPEARNDERQPGRETELHHEQGRHVGAYRRHASVGKRYLPGQADQAQTARECDVHHCENEGMDVVRSGGDEGKNDETSRKEHAGKRPFHSCPQMPCGLNNRMTMMVANPTSPAMCVVVREGRMPSMRPRMRPPRTAPGRLPNPPSMMHAMPFISAKLPMVGLMLKKGTDEPTRDGGKAASQEHGECRDEIDVYALQGRPVALLGDRKHRLTASAVPDEEEEDHQEDKTDQDDDEPVPRHGNAENMEDAREGTGVGQRLAARDKEDDALDYKGEAYGNCHRSVRIASKGSEADTFEEDAEAPDEKGGDKDGREEIHAELRHHVVDQVGADHVYLAVRDLHDPHDAEAATRVNPRATRM